MIVVGWLSSILVLSHFGFAPVCKAEKSNFAHPGLGF